MIFILILTGFAVGIVSTFFGLGGGVIIVPVLYTIFPDLPPQTAISTSLGVILINSMANVAKFTRRKIHPDAKLVILMGAAIITGILIGGKITSILDAHTLKRIFAVVLFLSAIKTAHTKTTHETPANWRPDFQKKDFAAGIMVAFLGGVVSAITGIGGGAVIIPILVIILKIPFHMIPAYANIVVLMGATTGSIFYMLQHPAINPFEGTTLALFQVGHLNWGIVLMIAPIAFFSAYLGIKWSKNAKPLWAKRLFALMLLIAAIKIWTCA